jgi:hypothetical protein
MEENVFENHLKDIKDEGERMRRRREAIFDLISISTTTQETKLKSRSCCFRACIANNSKNKNKNRLAQKCVQCVPWILRWR